MPNRSTNPFQTLTQIKPILRLYLDKTRTFSTQKSLHYPTYSIIKIIQKLVVQKQILKATQNRNHSTKNRQNYTQTAQIDILPTYQISGIYRRYSPSKKIITTLNQIRSISNIHRPILFKLTQKTIQYWGYIYTKAQHF